MGRWRRFARWRTLRSGFREALTAVKRASRNIVDAAGLQKAQDGFTQAQDAAEDYTQSVEKAKDSQKGLSQETLNSFKAASDLSVRLRAL